MSATTTPVVAARRAILIGTKEVTFTPYTIRKVGEQRQVVIDKEVQSIIYNPHRGLTYLHLNIDGVQVGGRIAAELVADCSYDSFAKTRKVAPVVAKAPVEAKAPVVAKAPVQAKAPVEAKTPAAAKVRRPKSVTA
jgi:hypothetical protein